MPIKRRAKQNNLILNGERNSDCAGSGLARPGYRFSPSGVSQPGRKKLAFVEAGNCVSSCSEPTQYRRARKPLSRLAGQPSYAPDLAGHANRLNRDVNLSVAKAGANAKNPFPIPTPGEIDCAVGGSGRRRSMRATVSTEFVITALIGYNSACNDPRACAAGENKFRALNGTTFLSAFQGN